MAVSQFPEISVVPDTRLSDVEFLRNGAKWQVNSRWEIRQIKNSLLENTANGLRRVGGELLIAGKTLSADWSMVSMVCPGGSGLADS